MFCFDVWHGQTYGWNVILYFVGLVPPNVMTLLGYVGVCGGMWHFQWDVWHIVFDGMPCFVLTFGTAKPTDAIQFGILCVWCLAFYILMVCRILF